MSAGPEWTPSQGLPCTSCGTVVAMVSEGGSCPLCWAGENGADPDQTVGQTIAIEALWLMDTDPRGVAACIERLHSLAEHATRPALTAVLSDAARDLEILAAE